MQGSRLRQNVAALSTLPGVTARRNVLVWKVAAHWVVLIILSALPDQRHVDASVALRGSSPGCPRIF